MIVEDRVWVAPVYRLVGEQQWVEPVYRTVYDHVWVAPVTRTDYEKQWVPDRYEWRVIERALGAVHELSGLSEIIQIAIVVMLIGGRDSLMYELHGSQLGIVPQ